MSGLIDVVLHEHSAYPRSPVGDDVPEEEDVSLELVESVLTRSPLLALLSFSTLACTSAERTKKGNFFRQFLYRSSFTIS